MDIPLFPLKTVLFPKCRMPLQIFELRYVEMIKTCLRNNASFGVVTLKSGEEVGRPGDIYDRGVLVDIVDWNQLPNGLLGISIAGTEVFTVVNSHIEKDNLLVGNVELRAPEPKVVLPPEFEHLTALLQNLLAHKAGKRMGMECDFQDAAHVSCLMGYLLPFSPEKKLALLGLESSIERLVQIVANLDDMTEELNR